MKHIKQTVMQLLKFNVVGIVNTGVDFLVYTLLTEVLHVVYLPAKTVSYVCGVVNSYVLNSNWTFKKETKRSKREMVLFLLVNLVSLGASLLIMYICRSMFLIESDFLCNLIATPISMVVNFTGNKLFVFRQQDAKKPPRVQ